MKCKCGANLKISKFKTLLYALFGKTKRYITCPQCQRKHCIRLISHIVCDNADGKLKELNMVKTDWRFLKW